MRAKILSAKILIGIIAVLLIGVVILLKARNSNRPALAKNQGPQIEVIQLPTVSDVVPVEIQQAAILHNDKNDELTYFIKNNTNKIIDAIAVAYTYKLEAGGKEFSSKLYMTRNSLLHPDVREIHHFKPLVPQESWTIGPEPQEVDAETTLREITISIDFVDFADKTSLGPNERGGFLLQNARNGAAKYKNWLVQQYTKNGRSLNSLTPLLQESEFPPEINLGNYERTGANLYRRHFLMALQEHGVHNPERYLNR